MRKSRFGLAAAICIMTVSALSIGECRMVSAVELNQTERVVKVGDRVREGDRLSLPFWFPNFAGQTVWFYDENGIEMDSKFAPPGQDYMIPAYSEIWEKTKIPEGKAFDCWEVIKEPQWITFSFSWGLKRVLKDVAENEEPTPAPTKKPVSTQTPEEIQPTPAASPDSVPTSKPKPTNTPAVTERPDTTHNPSATVKPEIKPSRSPAEGQISQSQVSESPKLPQSTIVAPGSSEQLQKQETQDILEAGVYLLNAGNIYTLKSRLSDVNGDACVYAEGIKFRVDRDGSFTFQQELPE